jgi:hypothetical protein
VDNDLARAITQIGKVITAIIEDMTKGAAIDDKDVLRMAIEKFRQASPAGGVRACHARRARDRQGSLGEALQAQAGLGWGRIQNTRRRESWRSAGMRTVIRKEREFLTPEARLDAARRQAAQRLHLRLDARLSSRDSLWRVTIGARRSQAKKNRSSDARLTAAQSSAHTRVTPI